MVGTHPTSPNWMGKGKQNPEIPLDRGRGRGGGGGEKLDSATQPSLLLHLCWQPSSHRAQSGSLRLGGGAPGARQGSALWGNPRGLPRRSFSASPGRRQRGLPPPPHPLRTPLNSRCLGAGGTEGDLPTFPWAFLTHPAPSPRRFLFFSLRSFLKGGTQAPERVLQFNYFQILCAGHQGSIVQYGELGGRAERLGPRA